MYLILFIFISTLTALYIYSQRKGHLGVERRNRKKKHKTTHLTKHAQNDAFHCVEPHHHAHCCDAVKALHGKRFLSAEAPSLPVQGCNQAHCHCDYIHHSDRRIEVRRNDVGIQHDMYGQNGEVEHRDEKHQGRRKTDM